MKKSTSYPKIYEKEFFEGDTMKYNTTIIVAKEDIETVRTIKMALNKAIEKCLKK